MSKLKFSEVLDKMFKGMPPDAMPEFKLRVDRFLIQYWLNRDTQFTHKTTLDMAMSISITDSGETMSVNMAMNGEMRAKPVSEPIKFPDFSAPAFTPKQQKAAKLYWNAVEAKLMLEACDTVTTESATLWAAKNYTRGHDVAVKAAACFNEQRQAVAATTPPQYFAEGHKALSQSLETLENAYTAAADVFAFTAKGDTTAANARKVEADVLVGKGEQEILRASVLLYRAAEKYKLFE